MSSNVYTDDIITRTVAYVTYGTLLWFSSLQMVAFLDRCRSVMAKKKIGNKKLFSCNLRCSSTIAVSYCTCDL